MPRRIDGAGGRSGRDGRAGRAGRGGRDDGPTGCPAVTVDIVLQWEGDAGDGAGHGLAGPGLWLPLLKQVAATVVDHHAPPGAWQVDVTIADDDFLHNLNSRYRGLDTTTDVLSFPQLTAAQWRPAAQAQAEPAAASMAMVQPGQPFPLGDVVINWAAVHRGARRYGHSVAREAAFLLVHGVLHLLGWHHDDEEAAAAMEKATEAVLAPLGLQRGV